jgi:hypothetical protein
MHQPAAGADLPVKAPTKPSPFDWTGFYFGGYVGYAAGRSNWSATQVGAPAPILTGSLDLFNSYDAFKGPDVSLTDFKPGTTTCFLRASYSAPK